MIVDLEKNWARLHRNTTALLTDCEELIPLYRQLFESNKNDLIVDAQTTVLGMYRAPASKDRHHDFEGGLVAHMLEMWNIYEWMVAMFKSMDLKIFTASTIWRGIIHHDLNKVHRYIELQRTPLKVDYYENDIETRLLGAAQKSLNILAEHNIPLGIILHNALLTAEGGFSKSYPSSETTTAKMLYLLDDMSAGVVDRLRSGRYWDSRAGGSK